MMLRVAKVFGTIFVLLLTVVAIAVTTFLIRGDAFRETVALSPGKCRTIPSVLGSAEDIDIDRKRGTAYLSILDRRGLVLGKDVHGTILKVQLGEEELAFSPALEEVPDGFRPHGISLFEDSEGIQTLFVINHSRGVEERIEIFRRVEPEKLFFHTETLVDKLITHPNDLVAVSGNQFYIANDSGATNPIERGAEMIFGVGLSPLVFFDGSSFSVVWENLRSSGGINVDLDRKVLFVGETMGKTVKTFQIDENFRITEEGHTIELDSSVDNLDIDSEGNLWIANHINTLALVSHFGDPNSPAPSQIQRVDLSRANAYSIQTIYENGGEEISASSVGIRYGDTLLVGSITEPKILVCEILNTDN